MSKVFVYTDGTVTFECPGCKCRHAINAPDNMRWKWNGDIDKPTITPSILRKTEELPGSPSFVICHSFVTDGKIKFLDDCPHELKGKEVELPDIE